MDDSFFGFSTDISVLGAGKADSMELLTADVDEEEYDALNDETFGNDAIGNVDDWEEDHEKFAELDDRNMAPGSKEKIYHDLTSSQNSSYRHRLPSEQYFAMTGNIEESISQLVLDDDMDDPAIMNVSRSKSLCMKSSRTNFSISPPPPAIMESDHVGSPSTNSIWSTNAKADHSILPPNKSSRPLSSILTTLKQIRPHYDLQSEDPSIISAAKNAQISDNTKVIGAKLIPNVKTVEEIERDMLVASQRRLSPVTPKAQMLEEVERDILLKPRVRTVSEIERENAATQQIIANSTRHPIRPPPGFINGQSDHQVLSYLKNSTTQPLAIPGQRLNATPPVHSHHSPSPPLLTASSLSPPVRPHSPPPFPTMSSPYNGGSVRIQPYLTRMIPPQLSNVQRHPYLNPVPTGQPVLVGQLRYPPVIRPGSSLSSGLLPFPHSHFPVNFSDPRNVRRFPQPSHAMLNQMRPVPSYKRNCRWNESHSVHDSHSSHHLKDFNNGEVDEYANLMSQKEKDWLIKIQLMQLQTDNPYLDDYYFTTYSLKKRIKEIKDNAKNGEPTLVIPERSKVESKTYQPAHFEGSLGKLQVLSVNCPRRIIDLDVVHPDEAESEKQKVMNRELKRFRQLLLEIEKIYSLFLEIDDLDKKAAALPEEARNPLLENKNDIILKIYQSLLHKGSEHLGQMMAIRKGRNLVSRALPLFSEEQAHGILNAVLGSFSLILKRDQQDQVLQQLLESLSKTVAVGSFSQIVEFGLKLLNQGDEGLALSLSSQRSHFPTAFLHKVGISVICDMITRAEELYQNNMCNDTHLQAKWTHIVLHLVDVLCSLPDSSLIKPEKHYSKLITHFHRFPIESTKFDVFEEKIKILQENPEP